jgi:hypothetical protein
MVSHNIMEFMNVNSSQRIWAQCGSHDNDAVVLFFDTTPRVGGDAVGDCAGPQGSLPLILRWICMPDAAESAPSR